MSIKYPNIKVKLIGEDGNAFSILARVDSSLKKAKILKIKRNNEGNIITHHNIVEIYFLFFCKVSIL